MRRHPFSQVLVRNRLTCILLSALVLTFVWVSSDKLFSKDEVESNPMLITDLNQLGLEIIDAEVVDKVESKDLLSGGHRVTAEPDNKLAVVTLKAMSIKPYRTALISEDFTALLACHTQSGDVTSSHAKVHFHRLL